MNLFRKISLRWKLVGLPIGAVLLLSAAFCIATFLMLFKMVNRQSEQEVNARSIAIDQLLDLDKSRSLDTAKFLAASPALITAVGEARRDNSPVPNRRLGTRNGGNLLHHGLRRRRATPRKRPRNHRRPQSPAPVDAAGSERDGRLWL